MRDDIEFNIQFCEEIEKFPALYDFNRLDYCNRSVQEKAWLAIGKKLNASVDNCKDRWKNIRGRYAKYKKAVRSPRFKTKTVKEYYLSPHLHFLDNFLKTRKPKCKGDGKEIGENQETQNDEDDYVEDSDDEEHEPPDGNNSSLPFIATGSRVKKKMAPSLRYGSEITYKFSEEKKKRFKKSFPESSDPDMAFLQSILPDMKIMNSGQKRRFKIEVLNLAQQILEPSVLDGSPWAGSSHNGELFTTQLE